MKIVWQKYRYDLAGHSGDYELSPCTVVAGRAQSGKTTFVRGMQLAMTGDLSRLSRTHRADFATSRANKIYAELSGVAAGMPVRTSWQVGILGQALQSPVRADSNRHLHIPHYLSPWGKIRALSGQVLTLAMIKRFCPGRLNAAPEASDLVRRLADSVSREPSGSIASACDVYGFIVEDRRMEGVQGRDVLGKHLFSLYPKAVAAARAAVKSFAPAWTKVSLEACGPHRNRWGVRSAGRFAGVSMSDSEKIGVDLSLALAWARTDEPPIIILDTDVTHLLDRTQRQEMLRALRLATDRGVISQCIIALDDERLDAMDGWCVVRVSPKPPALLAAEKQAEKLEARGIHVIPLDAQDRQKTSASDEKGQVTGADLVS